MSISKDQLKSIMPLATADNLEKYCQPLNEAMVKFQIDSPKRIAAFIGQLAHESGSFSASVENLNYSVQGLINTWPKIFSVNNAALYAHKPEAIANLAYANRMGNGDEKTGEGWKFRGRGSIGITGKTNYDLCGKGIGADLVSKPELLEGPVYATASAAWFWSWRGLNLIADKEDYKQITLKINGGYIGLPQRIAFWEVAKKVII